MKRNSVFLYGFWQPCCCLASCLSMRQSRARGKTERGRVEEKVHTEKTVQEEPAG